MSLRNSVWKPLAGPVRDWPLALCDSRTLRHNDVVQADVVYDNFAAENCLLHYNTDQEWFYLANQSSSEALVFKATDSESGSTSKSMFTTYEQYDNTRS